jgi:signal transduction histidine kinase
MSPASKIHPGIRALLRPSGDDRGRERAFDAGLALASFSLSVGLIAGGGFGAEEEGARGLDVLGVFLALGTSLPLLARRQAIVPAFVVMFSAYAALAAFRYPIDIELGPLIGLYTLAGASGRRIPAALARALAVASYLAVFAGIAIGYDLDRVADIEGALFVLFWILIWMAGERAELRREQVALLEERAERAEKAAERERRLAAAEERAQIARDLHDSAGHAINVILVEAGAARLLRERDPQRAAQALATIEDVAREQIDEIDRLVQALRADESDDRAIEDCLVPGDRPTGPAMAEALFERMIASGLELDVKWIGKRRRLGPRVGRASFRILQEALTNAVRHGNGSASVMVDYRDDTVEFTIENPTDGDPADGGEGHGLTGMRERVALLDGSLETAQSNGIFRVRAVLPYDPVFERRQAFRSDGR